MRRLKTGIIIAISAVLLPLALYLAAGFNNPPDANATGGAFPDTKHGGGAVDGFPAGGGVDRAINTMDWGLFYNDNPKAGQYVPGECTHCHEPHASFGEAEPAPYTGGDAGPGMYLLLKEYGTSASYAEVCWYCHENMNFDPLYGGGTGFWRFYQGRAVYELSSHSQSPFFSWPGTTGDPVGAQIWPRKTNRSTLPSGNTGSCLNCHTPHGIKEGGASTAFDTAAVPTSGTNRHLSANNRSVSADWLIPRQLIAWEEGLCENCHDSSGPSTKDIKAEINKRTSGGSGHPVHDTGLAGRHSVGETIPLQNYSVACTSGNPTNYDCVKHVECYDCHNPHADNSANRLEGMKYVDINNATQDPIAGGRQPYIYEICFKCHGNTYNQVFIADYPFPDTTEPACAGYPSPTLPCRSGNTNHFSNKRKEFDPTTPHTAAGLTYNTSYHPVYAAGRNGTYNLFKQLENTMGLTAQAQLQTLTIQCTDCHNNDATGTMPGPATYSNLRSTDRIPSIVSPDNDFGTAPVGPHGSQRNRLLRGHYVTTNSTAGAFAYDWYRTNRTDSTSNPPGRPKFELCFICHEESRILGVKNDGSGYEAASYTNFGSTSFPTGPRYWNANLHLYHLNVKAVCHDCHHNVHSNVEAQNTYYGTGGGAGLPPDNHDDIVDGKVDTHLVNFGPQATSSGLRTLPTWWYDGTWFRCNLTCHTVHNMAYCIYQHGTGSWSPEGQWCGGG